MPAVNPPPSRLPFGSREGTKRHLKALRMPENYVYDAIRGYQGNEGVFNIFRVRPGLIPLDAKLVWITFDHTKHCAYVCIEHPSFPEYVPGKFCEEIPIELEELGVQRLLSGLITVDEGVGNPELKMQSYRKDGVERQIAAGAVSPQPNPMHFWEGSSDLPREIPSVSLGAKKLLAKSRAKGVRI